MFNPITIETQVRAFIAENFHYRGEVGSLPATASLLESGLVDSMGVLELVTFLESTFPLQIADDEVMPENLDTIAAIVAFVRRKCVPHLEVLAHAG
jgi:acyl carrier protein